MMSFLSFILPLLAVAAFGFFEWRKRHAQTSEAQLELSLQQFSERLKSDLHDRLFQTQQLVLEKISQSQLSQMNMLQDALQKGRTEMRDSLGLNTRELSNRVEKLTQTTEQRLKEISGQVEKRLSEGFEKTTQTFTDVVKRLALIDEAQKKISELSGNVVSLKDLLADKRSRGAFGEVQLESLIRNMIPDSHFAMQHTLSNGMRADCILFLPSPTGNIVIDAKFPLENFQRLMDHSQAESDRKLAEQAFRRDIKTHIQDIAEKYIVKNETTESAIMFIPAEAVFAEIHAHYPDLVEVSYRAKVWLASPTTMMAILTTVRAVLKDDATRKQVHIIQQHLSALSSDFQRFEKRMDGLARHIEQANEDVRSVHISAKKITSRFNKIEKVELDSSGQEEHPLLLAEELSED